MGVGEEFRASFLLNMLVTSSDHSLFTYNLSLNRPLSRLFLGTCSNQVFFCQPFPQSALGFAPGSEADGVVQM